MVAPISNDKLPSSNSPKAGGANTKGTSNTNRGSTETNAATSHAAKPADDTVNVDRANQLYRSASSDPVRSAGSISTAEEAAQLATRISEQLIADGAQAMLAQAGGLPNQVGTLLRAAP